MNFFNVSSYLYGFLRLVFKNEIKTNLYLYIHFFPSFFSFCLSTICSLFLWLRLSISFWICPVLSISLRASLSSWKLIRNGRMVANEKFGSIFRGRVCRFRVYTHITKNNNNEWARWKPGSHLHTSLRPLMAAAKSIFGYTRVVNGSVDEYTRHYIILYYYMRLSENTYSATSHRRPWSNGAYKTETRSVACAAFCETK